MLVYSSCVVMVGLDSTPLGPVHVNPTVTLVSTLAISTAMQVRVRFWFTIRSASGPLLRDGGATSKKEQAVILFPMAETDGACTMSTNSLCTVMFPVEFCIDEASITSDWQVYGLPWEVERGLNVRVRVVMLPALSGRLTVIPLTLVTIVPFGRIHCTTGWMLTSTVQVRVRVFPATVLLGPEMVTVCERSGEVGRSKV